MAKNKITINASTNFRKFLFVALILGLNILAFQNCGKTFEVNDTSAGISQSSLVNSTTGAGGLGQNPTPTPAIIGNMKVWSYVNESGAPENRIGAASVLIGERFFVWGGKSLVNAALLDTGGIYDPNTNTWAPVTRQGAPSARTFAHAIWTGTNVIVYGGDQGEASFTPSGAIYNPANNTWSSLNLQGAPSKAGGEGASLTWTGSKMIVVGGRSDRFGNADCRNSGGIFDPATNIWTALPASAGSNIWALCKMFHSAIWTGNRLLIFGGYSAGKYETGAGQSFDDLLSYDPVQNSLTQITSPGGPSLRYGHSAIWTGNQMVVWGGSNFNIVSSTGGALGDGAIYTPANNTWTKISSSGAASSRAFLASGLVDKKIIYYGGRTQSILFDGLKSDGAIFNPTANTWEPLVQNIAPGPISDAAFGSDGSRFIIFGGKGNQGALGAVLQ